MKVSPSDPILKDASGVNWVDESRSIFFNEDLDTTDGFVFRQNIAGWKAKKRFSRDDLYPIRQTEQTVGPFNDITHRIGEFEKSFSIDIPLCTGNSALTLTTDDTSEVPLISGTSQTTGYTAWLFNSHTYFGLSGQTKLLKTDYQMVKIGGNLDTHVADGHNEGWLDCTYDGKIYKRANFFGFSTDTSPAVSYTHLTLPTT